MATGNQPEQSLPKQELTGWKEIAEHLAVSERTARNWERERSLPIRRRGSTAVALRSELEQWKRDSLSPPALGSPSKTAATLPPARALPRRLIYSIAGVVIGMVLAVLGFAIHRSNVVPKGPPAEFWFRDKTLIVTNAQGQELWRHDFPDPSYRETYLPYNHAQYSWIGDIDGDGKTELLFLYKPLNDTTMGTPLFCFSEDGKVKWKFMGGRVVRDSKRVYSGIYFSSIRVLPNRKQILVNSNHSTDYPDQIVLLDSQGHVVGEYWHPGHLRSYLVANVEGVGKETLLLAGANIDTGHATLLALPVDGLPKPAPPQYDPADIHTLGIGSEKAAVVFPRSCITNKTSPSNLAFQVSLKASPPSIEVGVVESKSEWGSPPYLVYTFNSKLELESTVAAPNFFSWHKKLEVERKLDHAFTQAEIDQLKREVVVKRFP